VRAIGYWPELAIHGPTGARCARTWRISLCPPHARTGEALCARPPHGLAVIGALCALWPEVAALGPGGARGRAPPPTDLASLAGGDAPPAAQRWYFVGEEDGAATRPDAGVVDCRLPRYSGARRVEIAARRRRPPRRRARRCAGDIHPAGSTSAWEVYR
jgi:hypothetical protein